VAECRRALWLLGVVAPVDHAGVLKAWRKRVAQTHPDRHVGDEAREQAAATFRKKLGVVRVALTQRQTDSQGVEKFSGMLHGKDSFQRSRVHAVSPLGRIGSGDAFMAGLIHGALAEWPEERMIEFAAASACLKQTVMHDLPVFSATEIEEWILRGSGGGVRR